MKTKLSTIAVVGVAAFLFGSAGMAIGAPIILNEYNGVKTTIFLGGGDATTSIPADPYFGRVVGNGGDWMEFVVIQDNLDLRGWSFVTTQNSVADVTITIGLDSVFSNLRSGTIFTIAEDVASDFSYDPSAGDWWINYQASFSPEISGSATNDNFQVTIKDTLNNSVFGPVGEGVFPVTGLGSNEVFKLEADPSALINPTSNYKDGTSSTFGAANLWSGGTITQDFSQLRSSSSVPEPSSILALAGGLSSLLFVRRRRSK